MVIPKDARPFPASFAGLEGCSCSWHGERVFAQLSVEEKEEEERTRDDALNGQRRLQIKLGLIEFINIVNTSKYAVSLYVPI